MLCLPQYPAGHFKQLVKVFCWPPHTLKNFRKSSVAFSGTGSGELRWIFLGERVVCGMILHWQRRQSYTGNGHLCVAQSPSICAFVARIQEENICGGIHVAIECTSASWFLTTPVSSILRFPENGCSCGLDPRKWKVRFRRLHLLSEEQWNIQSTRALSSTTSKQLCAKAF